MSTFGETPVWDGEPAEFRATDPLYDAIAGTLESAAQAYEKAAHELRTTAVKLRLSRMHGYDELVQRG